ncbi:PQQ-binding-like beta-propeller repeat protein [Pseudooceanicola sp. C21-150M6]|uniref:outer membrane protein assembly factor BamB family protein n=1 Tax=Pseudooceanicola sp. C21-150M6 TaxID=3434355 RepID=UPI003D7FEDD8
MSIVNSRVGIVPGCRGALRFGLVVSVLLLAACEEKDPILPGKRENVDSVYTDVVPEIDPAATANRSEPVSLPPVTTNANWPQRPGSPATRTDNAAISAAPQRVWSVNIGSGDTRKTRITADPVVADGRVFALDSEARVTAVSTAGAVLWTRTLVPPLDNAGDATGGGLAYGDGRLFVSTGYGVLTALDAATGAVIWEQDLEAAGTGTPSYAGGLVYMVAADSTAWAIRAENGRVAWQISGTPNRNNLAGGPAPVIAGETVVFAFPSGELLAAGRASGLTEWGGIIQGRRPGLARAVVTDISSDPVVSNGMLISGVQSGGMQAFNMADGARLWSTQEGPMSSVWMTGSSVFLVSDRNELVRLDRNTGERVWGIELPLFTKDRPRRQARVYPHHGPVLAGNRLVVASGDGLLRFFDPASGSLTGQSELPGGATTNPVIAGGTLYVVSANGQLHAFR